MAALATTTQLEARLQTTVDAAAAAQALDQSSALVRSVARQQISFVDQETVILVGATRVLTLPERPVVVDGANPLTVTELGDFGGIDIPMLEGRDFIRVGDQLTRGYPWWWNQGTRLMGWPWFRPLGVWTPRVEVTYSHGYATVPDDIVSVVLDVAQALVGNPGKLRQVSIGDYSETFAAEQLGGAAVGSIREALSVTGHRRGTHSIRLG